MKYSSKVLNYLYRTEHAGSFLKESQSVFCAKMGSSNTLDVVELCVKIEKGTILVARFKAYGAVAMIAASEYLCEWLENKSIEEAKQLNREAILNELELPLTYIHHAALLHSALQDVTEQYLSKK